MTAAKRNRGGQPKPAAKRRKTISARVLPLTARYLRSTRSGREIDRLVGASPEFRAWLIEADIVHRVDDLSRLPPLA